MAFVLLLKPKVQKELNKLTDRERSKIILILEDILRDPFSGKKLEGDLKNCYSSRAWPYRIIYEIRKKELVIVVIKIGHRQGVYS
jgi:mRNA interferase RelE/StbE